MKKTKKSVLRFIDELAGQEHFDEHDVWVFRGGGACGICTHSAMHIARRSGGVVIGYWAEENQRALIGVQYADGHDFAVVADRWIVDYWAQHMIGILRCPILDMEDPNDKRTIRVLYGSKKRWSIAWDPAVDEWPFELTPQHEVRRQRQAIGGDVPHSGQGNKATEVAQHSVPRVWLLAFLSN